ncbi:PDZ and LIM domain protein 5a isoform X13 [Siniperca chuatsi]|uniref:PDZ and LIM domain protein 5a isoform X13 n=1 Tax=Siniperca chuatsi TaxID=119488 RepID=UPI001CE1DE27|nr:PDZ and LIM domain protein 5a isoform X13 [Siniperca chuatsi]
MSSNYSATLLGPAPWGFRLQGGKDFNMPLTISRLTDGGKAAKGGIAVGDIVLSIDGIATEGMNHLEAQNKIKSCTGNLSLTLQKASSVPKPPPVAPKDDRSDIIKPVALTHPPPPPHPHPHSTVPYNKIPRPYGGCRTESEYPPAQSPFAPFIPSPSSAFTPASSHTSPPPPPPPPVSYPSSSSSSPPVLVPPQPSVYNTPINLYSNENACEVAMGQRRGLLESQGGALPLQFNGGPQSILKKPQPPRVPRKHIVDTDIHFYHVPTHADASRKRIMEDTEDWRPRSGTTQSRSFRILAQMTGTEHAQDEEADTAKKTNSFTLSSSSCLTESETHNGKVRPAASDSTVTEPSSFRLPTAESNSPVTPLEDSTFSEKSESNDHLTDHDGDDHKLYSQATESLKAAQTQFDLSHQHSFPVQVNTHLSHMSARHHVLSTKPVRRELLSSPLDFLPRAAPCPPPLTPSAPKQPTRNTHAEHCSPVQARATYQSSPWPPEKAVSQSLLDALLITPIQAPPLRLRKKKKRHSVSELHLPKNKRVSWHQSATEEGDPLFSSPVNAVYVFSEEGEEPELNSHESAVVKTMIKGPTATQGHGPRTGLITPSFGMKGNGSASVPRGPVPARPVPQPHPKDEDTLVQMAEHIPAGTRTPMCAHCNMVIRGPFLVAMGKSWHKEEFNCAHCRTSLADTGFVEEQGSVYCEHCYEEFFAPTCSRCQAKILGEVINALKQTWHVYCFLCACCQRPIRNNTFHLEDGEPYCEQDFYSLFGTGCHGCEFPVEAGDKFLEALGYTWHDTCFVCAVCCTTLEGQTFFSKKDKPLCKKHAHTLKI